MIQYLRDRLMYRKAIMDNPLVHNNVPTNNSKEQLGTTSLHGAENSPNIPVSASVAREVEAPTKSTEVVKAQETMNTSAAPLVASNQQQGKASVQTASTQSYQSENIYAKDPQQISDKELKDLSKNKVNTVAYWFSEFVKWMKEKNTK